MTKFNNDILSKALEMYQNIECLNAMFKRSIHATENEVLIQRYIEVNACITEFVSALLLHFRDQELDLPQGHLDGYQDNE